MSAEDEADSKVYVTNAADFPSGGGGGGGGAVTVADGADVAQGTTTDAAATGNGSVIGILKRLRSLLNGGLPAALGAGGGIKIDGSGTALPVSGTVAVSTALATEATLDARTGSLTEVAPATDTAASGINGRLQRIAQRLTSVLTALGGGLPAALGAGGGLKIDGSGTALPVAATSFSVVLSTTSSGLTTATTLYTAGDQLGGLVSWANAVRSNGGTGRIDSALLKVDTASVVSAVDLFLFSGTVTVNTDNAGALFSDSDMDKLLGVIEFRAAKNLTQNAVLLGLNLPIIIKPTATTLFGALVTQVTHTVHFTASSDLVPILGIVQD